MLLEIIQMKKKFYSLPLPEKGQKNENVNFSTLTFLIRSGPSLGTTGEYFHTSSIIFNRKVHNFGKILNYPRVPSASVINPLKIVLAPFRLPPRKFILASALPIGIDMVLGNDRTTATLFWSNNESSGRILLRSYFLLPCWIRHVINNRFLLALACRNGKECYK